MSGVDHSLPLDLSQKFELLPEELIALLDNPPLDIDTLTLGTMSVRKLTSIILSRIHSLTILKQPLPTENETVLMRAWSLMVYALESRVHRVNLPKNIEAQTLPYVKPIGWEIKKWKNFLDNNLHNFECFDYDKHITFTSQGTIDYMKTASNIVRHGGNLTLAQRYFLSCLFCLELDVRCIWKMFEDKERDKIREYAPSFLKNLELFAYWTLSHNTNPAIIDCQITTNQSSYECAFKNAVTSGHIVATRFFYQKLVESGKPIPLEIATNIAASYSVETHGDVFSFLVEARSEEQRLLLFREKAFACLRCYMEWPRQKDFTKVLDCVWFYLTHAEYHAVICILASRYSLSSFDYTDLFREAFLRSPPAYKTALMKYQVEFGTFLSHLFAVQDEASIKVVIRNSLPTVKEQIFDCFSGFHICLKLALAENWKLLDLFIDECMLTRAAKPRIIEKYREFIRQSYPDEKVEWEDLRFIKMFEMIERPNTFGENTSFWNKLNNSGLSDQEVQMELSKLPPKKRITQR